MIRNSEKCSEALLSFHMAENFNNNLTPLKTYTSVILKVRKLDESLNGHSFSLATARRAVIAFNSRCVQCRIQQTQRPAPAPIRVRNLKPRATNSP